MLLFPKIVDRCTHETIGIIIMSELVLRWQLSTRYRRGLKVKYFAMPLNRKTFLHTEKVEGKVYKLSATTDLFNNYLQPRVSNTSRDLCIRVNLS